MNVVLDQCEEVETRKKSVAAGAAAGAAPVVRRPLGRILLKGDNITAVAAAPAPAAGAAAGASA